MTTILKGLLLAYCCFFTPGHEKTFEELFECGKKEFNNAEDSTGLDNAIKCLEEAVALEPENQEALYYLGYSYSRRSAFDAESIPKSNPATTAKAASYFERVIKVNPKYEGEIISQGPYAKIGSEWGSLALKYIYNDDIDSATWAYEQALKLGIYNDYILEFNRQMLESCTPNAILFASGDVETFPLFYLQYIKKVRPDVSIVDVTLLHTAWMPGYLQRKKIVRFEYSPEELSEVNYMQWSDSLISVPVAKSNKKVEWTLKPTYKESYILRGDLLMLDIIVQNRFKRDVFMSLGTSWTKDRSLFMPSNIMEPDFLIVKIVPETNREPGESFFKNIDAFNYSTFNNAQFEYNREALIFLSEMRYSCLEAIGKLIDGKKRKEAKALYKKFKERLSEKVYPYDENVQKYIDYIEEKLG